MYAILFLSLGAMPPQAPRPPQAPPLLVKAACPCGCASGGVCTCPDCPDGVPAKQEAAYQRLREYAEYRRGEPVVVFVGQDVPDNLGAGACRWDRFPTAHPDVPSPSVVIGRVIYGGFTRVEVLPGRPSVAQVRDALQRHRLPGAGAGPAPVAVVPPGSHSHMTTDGRTIVHSDANYGNPAAHAGVAWPWLRTAGPGQMVPAFGGFQNCPNGNCPRP